MDVTLHPLDERGLADLLDAAVAGAEPAEVMPAPDGARWDDGLRAGFRAFHRVRSLGPDPVECTWVVRADGAPAGALRLQPGPVAEAGLWLGRGFRGRGIGTAAVRLLRAAPGARDSPLIARTTAGNAGALGLLRALGATPEPGAEGAVTVALGTDDHGEGRASAVDRGPGRPIH